MDVHQVKQCLQLLGLSYETMRFGILQYDTDVKDVNSHGRIGEHNNN